MAKMTGPRLQLRILATSDLHAHILPWDDLTDQPAPDRGLAQVASLIAQARAEGAVCLLLDNGDFLNGSPLADHVAETRRLTADAPHPMIAAMNRLGYDAATLGNHEFSNGLPLLRQALRHARFALVATNLDLAAPSVRRPFLPRFTLVPRMLADDSGALHKVTVGIIGVLPPQTALWERRHLQDRLVARDILTSVKACLPQVRRAGADIVIALSHSGLGGKAGVAGAENISCALAAMEGIDAVIAGHTHQVYPPQSNDMEAGASMAKPLAAPNCPLVMPGFYGSHLGVIDLTLSPDPRPAGARWRVVAHEVALRPVSRRQGPTGRIEALVAADLGIIATAQADTAAMRARAILPVGETSVPLHSFFALIGRSPVQDLLAAAQAANMHALMAGLPEAALPMLVSVAPFKAGGRGGPANFTDIPAGPLTARNIADLYIHPNSPVALRVTGRDLAEWLERSVSLFHQIPSGAQDAALIDTTFPAYNFDMIHGLSFLVDLAQPARFDVLGQVVDRQASRIVNLRYQGQPIAPDRPFVLVTNSYRASGGAGFAGTNPADVVMEDSRPLRRILHDHIATQGGVSPDSSAHWGFVSMPGTSVYFDSAPAAADHCADVPGLLPVGLRPSGFLRFRLTL